MDGQVVILPGTREAAGDTSCVERHVSVREGLRVGFFVTRVVTWYCAALVGVFGVVVLFRSPLSFSAFLADLIVMPGVIAGYLVAFCLGGVVWAATSRFPRHRTYDAIRGFAIVSSVCGVMAVVALLIEGRALDGGFIAGVSSIGGLVGGVVGCVGSFSTS